MKKSVEEILKEITPNTKIEVFAGYCDTVDEFIEIINKAPDAGDKNIPTFEEMQKFEEYLAEYDVDKTNIANIQAVLRVPYAQAQRIAEWFQDRENDNQKEPTNDV